NAKTAANDPISSDSLTLFRFRVELDFFVAGIDIPLRFEVETAGPVGVAFGHTLTVVRSLRKQKTRANSRSGGDGHGRQSPPEVGRSIHSFARSQVQDLRSGSGKEPIHALTAF